MQNSPEVMTFEDYCASKGAQFPSEPGMHKRGNASPAAWKRAMKSFQAELDSVWRLREKLRVEFEAKIAEGSIRLPSYKEKLIFAANGHPDRMDTKAARNLCEKKGISWK